MRSTTAKGRLRLAYVAPANSRETAGGGEGRGGEGKGGAHQCTLHSGCNEEGADHVTVHSTVSVLNHGNRSFQSQPSPQFTINDKCKSCVALHVTCIVKWSSPDARYRAAQSEEKDIGLHSRFTPHATARMTARLTKKVRHCLSGGCCVAAILKGVAVKLTGAVFVTCSRGGGNHARILS